MKTFDISTSENKASIVMDWYGDLHDVMPEDPRYIVIIDIGSNEADIRLKLIKKINNQ